MDIDDYLQGAERVSPGEWTIDAQRALELTAHFSFPEWQHWLLKFVQAAVVSRATRVDLSLNGNVWTLRHDGDPVSDLGFLDALRADTAAQAARRHLALGLRVALNHKQLSRGELLLSYDGAHRLWKFSEEPGLRNEFQSSPGDDGWEGTQVRVWWSKTTESGPSQRDFLRSTLRYAPVPVYLDGALLNNPRFDKPSVPQWIWLAPELGAETMAVATGSPYSQYIPAAPGLDLEAERGGALQQSCVELTPALLVLPCWGWQTLTPNPGRHLLAVVHHGVLLPYVGVEDPKSDPAGSQATITSEGLTLDLTGCRIVCNEAFDSRFAAVRRNFKRLFRAYSRAFPGAPDLARLSKGY